MQLQYKTYRVALQFAVCADVKQPARRVVRTSAEGIPVREELDRVNVGVVSRKCLYAFLLSNVPKFRECVTGAGDELIVVERVDAQTHHVTQMIRELMELRTSLDIPKHTGHVAGGSENTAVVDESTAR